MCVCVVVRCGVLGWLVGYLWLVAFVCGVGVGVGGLVGCFFSIRGAYVRMRHDGNRRWADRGLWLVGWCCG